MVVSNENTDGFSLGWFHFFFPKSTVIVTRVPCSAKDCMEYSPPIKLARSCIFLSPIPKCFAEVIEANTIILYT